MASKIEWTGESWNPIRARVRGSVGGATGWHCEHASPGCQNCYSETQNVAQRFNLGTGLPYKPGHRKDVEIWLDETALVKPLSWKRGRKVFVCSMTDLFAEFVTDEWIDRIFAVMALCPQHTFQVLTKRARRMREYCRAMAAGDRSVIMAGKGLAEPGVLAERMSQLAKANPACSHTGPLPNVWLGVSVEDQQRADERIPDLLATPAAVRWISAEPLLGPVDLTNISGAEKSREYGSPVHGWSAIWRNNGIGRACLDWVVVGGESGSKARPMHPDWARSLRDQCGAAGVPFFFKQWGSWAPFTGWHDGADRYADEMGSYSAPNVLNLGSGSFVVRVGKKRAGRLLDGVEHNGMLEVAHG